MRRIIQLFLITNLLVACAIDHKPGGMHAMIESFDAQGRQLVRLDDGGNALDAHDGGLALFNGVYHLYGTSYGCGFEWFWDGRFCGFKSYSSTDLVHFKEDGLLFDPAAYQTICVGNRIGCFRPHVVYNASTRRYVLWFNSYETGGGYHVMESDRPDGGFTEVGMPSLAVNGLQGNGDENLFVDDDGTGYVIYTDFMGGYDQVIEQLTPDYHHGTGRYVRLGLHSTEAPSLFRRDGHYYVTVSDPNCAYCRGTGASYLVSSSVLSGWSRAQHFTDTSCGGQPSNGARVATSDGDRFLFQSDLWDGEHNEALANLYFEPLELNGDAIGKLSCAPSFDIAFPASGPATATVMTTSHFRQVDDLGSVTRRQAFRADHSGTVDLALAAFQHGKPDAPLHVALVHVVDGNDTELASHDFPADEVAWSAQLVHWPAAGSVVAGEDYAVVLSADVHQGSYGVLVDDQAMGALDVVATIH
jgi:hypothetical protein